MATEQQRAFREFERSGWNEIAASYAVLGVQAASQLVGPLLDAVAVGAGDRVLDVATGPGWIAAGAAARGAEVVGVDISEAMIDEARRLNPGISFEVCAAEELRFGDGEFDAVVSSLGMPHFADHRAVFAEAHRVLRPGGRLAVSSWNPPAKCPFFAVALGAIATAGSLDVDLPEGVDMFAWADDDLCRDLFDATGFGPPERRELTLEFESDDGVRSVLEVLEHGTVRSRALYDAQTDEAKVAIADRIAEMLAPMESDGVWTVPAGAFVLSASRD